NDISKYGKRSFLPKNTIVYSQGEAGKGLYFIEKGLVKIKTRTAKGNEFLLKIALPNNLFGLESMDHLEYYTSAETIENSVLYFFPNRDLDEIIQQNPTIEHFFLESVITEMNILALKIFEDKLPAHQKIARILLNVYDEYKKYNISLKQKD